MRSCERERSLDPRALEDLLWGIYFNYKIGRGRKAGALFKLDGRARAHNVGRTLFVRFVSWLCLQT